MCLLGVVVCYQLDYNVEVSSKVQLRVINSEAEANYLQAWECVNLHTCVQRGLGRGSSSMLRLYLARVISFVHLSDHGVLD